MGIGNRRHPSEPAPGCPLPQAKLLGYPTFAHLSMAKKMATLEKADTMLEQLRQVAYGAAERDLQDVKDFARQQGCEYELQHWDVGYWAERLKETKYQVGGPCRSGYGAGA